MKTTQDTSERDFWKAERERIKAFLSDAGYETIQSEQAWKDRALTAEAQRDGVWEAAAKIAEAAVARQHKAYRRDDYEGYAEIGYEQACDAIAAAIRSAGAVGS